MKIELVLMSHGNMAYETLQSAKMIFGEITDIDVISMHMEDGLEGTLNKLQTVLSKLGDVPTIIAVDLLGGTPCNVANMLVGNRQNVRIITGLTLAMVIEYAMSQEIEIDTLTDYLVTVGKNAVQKLIVKEEDCDIDE